ncbi:MAG: NAD(P)H-hydrate dehydratase [Pyrinomonadaceae bacterium]|nr:NAD(P)H-hydrate dehydratase [Pyrinomonadaceae bacterium]
MVRSKTKKSTPYTLPPTPSLLSPRLLRGWPLPQPDEEADKDERGRVLVVGGALEMPGAVMLAATAALRAGAGKLQIATCRSIAQAVAVAIPEARVFALPETKKGGIAASAASLIAEHANKAQAVLIGPGMVDEGAVMRLMKGLLPRLKDATIVLDAGALSCFSEAPDWLHKSEVKMILTPHAGEMAGMLNVDVESLRRDPLAIARRAASEFKAVIALKGRETFIVAPDGEAYCNRAGNVGLATSGSGDTLSGIIAGLAARGADPLRAAAWGVHLHARAGDRLAKRVGRLGFLARELLAEIPSLMSGFDKRKKL